MHGEKKKEKGEKEKRNQGRKKKRKKNKIANFHILFSQLWEESMESWEYILH